MNGTRLISTFRERLASPTPGSSKTPPAKTPTKNEGVIERQRHAVLIYSCLGVIVLSLGMLLIALSTRDTLMSELLYLTLLAIALTVLLLYLRCRLSVIPAISVICTVNQLLISLSMIVRAYDGSPYGINVIIGDMVLAVSNILLVIGAYIRRMPYILATLILFTYGYCLWITGNSTIGMMLPIFYIPVITLALTGQRLAHNVRLLEQEKDRLREDEEKILNLFELDKTQLMAYIALAREKGLSFEQTRLMLDSAGRRAEENIRDNVARYMRQSQIDYENIAQRLPELSPSEIEICRLILRDKKLKEISAILDKSQSNVTCQRTNIRAKLGLRRGDNLHEALRNRVGMNG